MIGAMPAVAVRHERRRGEKRGGGGRRPSQLALQLGGRNQSPINSPADLHGNGLGNELYICGRLSVLYAIVGSLLLGIVTLVVGLVQLSPGAEAAQHKFYLLGAGASLIAVGVIAALLRCMCLHLYNRKMGYADDDEYEEAPAAKNVSVVESGHGDGHKSSHGHTDGHKRVHHADEHKPGHKTAHEKPRLKSQASVDSPPKPARTRELDALIKQPSAASDT